jgi:hypothetical protein
MNNMVLKEAILAASESSDDQIITKMAHKRSIAALKQSMQQKSSRDTVETSKAENAEPAPPKKSIDLHGPGKSNIISKMGGQNNQVEVGTMNKTENATAPSSLQTL